MKVSGKITDMYGALGGASINLIRDNQRTNLGVSSDDDGSFEIENEQITPNDIFEIRFLGTKPQLKKASELQNAEIFMEEDIDELDAVVITSNLGTKPKDVITNQWEEKWYTKPAFVFSVVGLITVGAIFYIIKKTK
jgi:hypothetical protein